MAYRCEICGKEVKFGRKVSHSNKHSSRKFRPNVQKVRAVVNGKVKRIRACTTCISSGRITKP